MIDRKNLEFTSFSLFLLIIISIFSVLTFQRNAKWFDESTLWEDAKLKSPSKSRPYTYAGIAYAKEKQFEEAYSNLSRAIILNPGDIEARYNISILYMELNRYDLAEIELKGAIESRPDLKEPYLALAELYAKTGRPGKATTILTGADTIWPEDIIIRLKLATSLAMSGKITKAKEGYRWVLARTPMETEAISGLGNIYMLEKKPALAISYYERAIRLRPDEPESIFNAALVLEELGETKKAAKYYALYIKVASSSPRPSSEAIMRARERIRIIRQDG